MANTAPPKVANQHFPQTEILFHRVHRANIARGKATAFAFTLPDMSCNRETESTAEEARKGFYPEDWGVAGFAVQEIPPREALAYLSQFYRLLARHVPEVGNFAHSEVRVWRTESGELLVTARQDGDFPDGDPDRGCARGHPDVWLDPDFHMKWRRRIAQSANLVLGPRVSP